MIFSVKTESYTYFLANITLCLRNTNFSDVVVCNGEPPATVPFGGEHWCQPIVTMHHATPEDISNLWRFQRHREDEERNQSVSIISQGYLSMKRLSVTFIIIETNTTQIANPLQRCPRLFPPPSISTHTRQRKQFCV